MKTDQLIDVLARGAGPVEKRRWRVQLAVTILTGLVVAVVLVAIGLGVRPDIGAKPVPMLMKAAFSAFAAAAVLPLTLRLMKPGRPLGWRMATIAVFVAVCALAALIALMGEPPAERMRAWMGGGFPWCIVVVPLLAAPTAAGLLWLMRAFAPTRLTLAGAAIGAFSGGVGAMAYSMYCPVDSVAFVTTWYVVAIAICAALGALAGARLLRW
ncbi:MAG: DUF1109 domain-containing protein [Hyphomonadaceae bacterium]|nr:DUF1109 domain-containing protein [Hyphomonadaceae bacterium]